jgi:hypothetical protein
MISYPPSAKQIAMNDANDIGMVVTGGIVAGAVDSDKAAGHGAAEVGGACLNCGTVRAGPFCQACGQSGHVHRSIVALGHDVLHGVFHFEGRIWRTLPMLAFHPGDLTRRYVRGERAKFVSPMALFLFSVFLLFAAMGRVTSPDMTDAGQTYKEARGELSDEVKEARNELDALKAERTEKLDDNPKADLRGLDRKIAKKQEDVDQVATTAKAMRAILPDKPDAPAAADDDDDGWHISTGIQSLDRRLNAFNSNRALFFYKLKTASSNFSWALVPISMPFIWLLFFWRRDVGLYDHAIFALHSLSFMTLLVVGLVALRVTGVSQGWLWLALALAPPIHMYKHLKYAYGLGRFGALWRSVTLLSMTSVTSVLFIVLLFWLEAE